MKVSSIMEISITNLAKLCRVCTEDISSTPFVNIYDQETPDSLSLYMKLRTICSEIFVVEDDKSDKLTACRGVLPQTVCSECKIKIDLAFNLRNTCLETHRRLWKMLKHCTEPCINQDVDKAENKPSHTEPSSCDQKDDEEIANIKATPTKLRKPRNYRCEICSTTMHRPNAVKKHMKLKHSGEIFYCSNGRCDEVFFSETKLEEHKQVHATGLRHVCHICQKRCKSLYYLREHMNIHTGETPYLCPECGKGFSNKPSLRQHLVRHSDQKAFDCGQCPSKFHTKGALKVHMLTHTKEKNFPCETCGASFNLKHALFSHTMVHTNERPHGCKICDMRFRTTDHLKRHIRTHTGEKPYKCSECDRSFAQSNDLVKHSKTHYGENPYQCDRCEASFRLITDLRNHYKVHFLPCSSECTDTKPNSIFQHLEQDSGKVRDSIKFTIVSTLNRRAEQEKKKDKRKVEQQPSVQKNVEMVQTILADLSEFPEEKEN